VSALVVLNVHIVLGPYSDTVVSLWCVDAFKVIINQRYLGTLAYTGSYRESKYIPLHRRNFWESHRTNVIIVMRTNREIMSEDSSTRTIRRFENVAGYPKVVEDQSRIKA